MPYDKSHKKKVKKAQTGTAVAEPAAFDPLDFGINPELLQRQAEMDLRSQEISQAAQLANVLMNAQALFNPQDTGPGPGPVGDILQEQRLRAAQAAQGSQGQYVPGFAPGGLFDAIGAFIERTGGTAPSMGPMERMNTRVPMGSLDDAIAAAARIAQSGYQPAQAPSGPFAEQLMSILGPLLASQEDTSAPEGSSAAGDTASYTGQPPSLAYPPQYDEPAGPTVTADLGGEGLANLVNSLVSEGVDISERGGVAPVEEAVLQKLFGLLKSTPHYRYVAGGGDRSGPTVGSVPFQP